MSPPMSGMFSHVNVISEPTFTALVTVRVPYEIEQYAEMERESRRNEEELVSEQLQMLRGQMKSLKVAQGSESLGYEDLCIHPDVDMPVGYNPQSLISLMGRETLTHI